MIYGIQAVLDAGGLRRDDCMEELLREMGESLGSNIRDVMSKSKGDIYAVSLVGHREDINQWMKSHSISIKSHNGDEGL